MMKKLLWKFLNDGMKSSYGNCIWKIGEWKVEQEAVKCSKGFHGSTNILDAFTYVKGSVLARVEVKGKCDKGDDKQAWTEMKIEKAYHWKKEDSVKLAIYAAELVIGIYKKKYPNDQRPREAIEAAKAYLKNPGKDSAAAAAYAADSAVAAADSAAAVTGSGAAVAAAAAAAAYAADSAVAAGAAAAYAAAYAADSADSAASVKKINAKIEKWLVAHVKELEEIKK